LKKFNFRLEQVRRWRESQRDAEEARLQALFAELHQLERARVELGIAAAKAEQAVRPGPDAPLPPMQELQALDSYRGYVRRECRRLAGLRSPLEARIAIQRRALTEAERKMEVLDLLREEKLEEWKKELDKEQEDLVAELVVARWARAC
jgi:flagellar export protein FliJ